MPSSPRSPVDWLPRLVVAPSFIVSLLFIYGLLSVTYVILVVVVGYELGGWHTGSQRGDGAASAP